MLRALEIMAHFDPLMWVIENPATGLLKTRPFMERLPRHLLQVRDSVQEADPTVDQHALETEPSGSWCDAWEDGRHLRGAQGGPRLMGGQRERVRKKGTCLFPVPNSTRAGPEKMGHACFQFRTLRGHFFLSRHALRRRPISRPTWHTATARRLRLRTLSQPVERLQDLWSSRGTRPSGRTPKRHRGRGTRSQAR